MRKLTRLNIYVNSSTYNATTATATHETAVIFFTSFPNPSSSPTCSTLLANSLSNSAAQASANSLFPLPFLYDSTMLFVGVCLSRLTAVVVATTRSRENVIRLNKKQLSLALSLSKLSTLRRFLRVVDYKNVFSLAVFPLNE